MSLKGACLRIIKKALKIPVVAKFLIWLLTHIPSILPIKIIEGNSDWSACFHPDPSYPFHVLLLPHQSIKTLLQLSDEDQHISTSLWQMIKKLIGVYGLETHGYRVIINGGAYQEFPIIHVHLVSDMSTKSLTSKE